MGARKTMGRDKNVQLAQDTCPRYFAALLLGYYCVIYRVITALLPPYFRAIAAFLPRYYCVIRVISARQRNFCISNCSCFPILGRVFITGSTGVSVNQLSPRSRNKLSLHSACIFTSSHTYSSKNYEKVMLLFQERNLYLLYNLCFKAIFFDNS